MKLNTERIGQFYVQLCTENQCNRATLMAFYTNFATEFFHTVLTRRSVLKGILRRDQKVIFVKIQFLALISQRVCKTRECARRESVQDERVC